MIQVFYDCITGTYAKLLCVRERVGLAPVSSFPMGLLSLYLAIKVSKGTFVPNVPKILLP